MGRPNPAREAAIRYVEAVEIFHTLYIGEGPYKSNVPRLVGEIVERLSGGPEMKSELLSMFGRRGGRERARLSSLVPSGPSQLELFDPQG